MQIPDCYDPVYREERRQLALTARMAKRPCCVGCGGRIWSEQYLDLEPFGLKGYACEQCLKKHMGYTDNLEENENGRENTLEEGGIGSQLFGRGRF